MRPSPPRTVLMLQGPPCRFWRELGDGLRAEGFRVLHVGFCLADLALWRRRGQRLWRGRLADWPAHLSALIAAEGVTDILYYADRLPYHAAAIEVARAAGIRAWAIENGYLRPDWLTMEPEAMGALSRFPRDPAEIRRLAGDAAVPEATPRYRHGFAREAVSEVVFHLAMVLGRPIFPNYMADKHYPPLLDYLSWLRKWSLGGAAVRAAARAEAACRRRDWPFVLLAMQLQSDYQIRASSPYGCLSEMLEDAIASFAAHAPARLRLVVKLHPMDNGWENWPARIARLARAHGVADRVLAIDGGSLDLFLERAEGVLTVNSTVGIHALRRGRPVLALGDAVYDMPGLTHQGGLGRFWARPEAPEPELRDAFLAALADRIQLRGSFYDPAGRAAAVAEIARRLGKPERHWLLCRPVEALGLAAQARPGGTADAATEPGDLGPAGSPALALRQQRQMA
ncbi:capsule biosynthesis protein [Paralimibaculum aggregatum]|uniref:Capsule biosynthesis protein n=1 Tax=Paralimibaculum aggregatum TaxID=3036245 RepID=A0ABQ6LBL9_9RHOB|nr:capsular biosynthesis protein [Limibaculum sp. NKW23]GMG80807.1 capsule biosynthesis protein [Limibaculum sp. NKW23]